MDKKICSKCKVEKPLSDFGKHAREKSGIRRVCKTCNTASAKDYYARNKESVLAYHRIYDFAHRHEKAEYDRAYHIKNGRKKSATSADWYLKNKDRAYLSHQIYSKSNPDLIQAIRLNYLARKKGAKGSFNRSDIIALFRKQHGRCAICGEKLKRYHIDHIVPLKLGGTNNPHNLQLTHGKCNQRKGAKDPVLFAQENGKLL